MFNFIETLKSTFSTESSRKHARKGYQHRTLAPVEMLERREMMTAGIASPVLNAVPANEHVLIGNPAVVSGHVAGTTTSSATNTNVGVVTTLTPNATINKFAPAVPTLTATAVSGSETDLHWTAAARATSYSVLEWEKTQWIVIGTVGSNVTSYGIPLLTPNTSYSFDVAAINSFGSTWGASKSVSTVDLPGGATYGYQVATGTLFGSGGPSYKDVAQGGVGDCWLLASLAETAARDPNDIKNMFTSAGSTTVGGVVNNFYNVHLYNNAGQKVTVTIDSELPSGGGLYDHPINGVLWVALAEKAYVQANGKDFVTTHAATAGSDNYSAIDGGDPVNALRAITGKAATDYVTDPSYIASTWKTNDLIVLTTTTPGSSEIVGNHVYAVVAYNPSSSLPFEVFNPWGVTAGGASLATNNGQSVYGLFYCNATFLTQNFADFAQGLGATPTTEVANNGVTPHVDSRINTAAVDAAMSKAAAVVTSHDNSNVLDSITKSGSQNTHAIDDLFAHWNEEARLDFAFPTHS